VDPLLFNSLHLAAPTQAKEQSQDRTADCQAKQKTECPSEHSPRLPPPAA